MPVVHEGLESELAHVENPDEQRHIRALWDEADPSMQEISYQLIIGPEPGSGSAYGTGAG